MNTRILAAGALLLASLWTPTFAESSGSTGLQPTSFAATSMVGKWVHNARGDIIGGVRGLSNDGQTAEILVGTYFQPGSHVATVPASALSMVNGDVTLRTESLAALDVASRK